jgi:hypothetical protein
MHLICVKVNASSVAVEALSGSRRVRIEMPYLKTENVQAVASSAPPRNWAIKLHSALVGVAFAFVIAVIFGLVP